MGSLASGLAHEINNPIQSILNYAHLIRRRSKDPELHECADEITHEAQRVASIVRNLQSFVQDREELPMPVRLGELVERTCQLFGAALYKEGIAVDSTQLAELPEVVCRPRAVEQILVNLLMGARDALNDRYPGGSSQNRVVIRAVLAAASEVSSSTLRQTVEDSGTPIADRDVSRVFEPFAALPGRDQGAGLGLAVSYDIARANGGTLAVERVGEECTRFHLELPLDSE
jgi:C4-dicarboxylate-specific signal transduction histidine kinase